MSILNGRVSAVTTGLAALAVALVGCSAGESVSGASTTSAPSSSASATSNVDFPLTVTDMSGEEVTIESEDSVVVTDNRLFGLVADWGIELSAAPRALMSDKNPMADDDSILDLGKHMEPDFEKVVEADPDLIINGYRFGNHADEMKKAAPDAAFVNTDNKELGHEEYIEQSVTLLGEIFGKQDQAKDAIDDFHTAIKDAKSAYDPSLTSMGLVTSGSEIRYASPDDGRGSSVFFDLIGMTPALDKEGSTNHQGDDISIEAIAQANPDFFLVLDRDSALDHGKNEVTPAKELINGSAALADVPAVKDQAIYVMPSDFYLTEGIGAYTTVLNDLTKEFTELK